MICRTGRYLSEIYNIIIILQKKKNFKYLSNGQFVNEKLYIHLI